MTTVILDIVAVFLAMIIVLGGVLGIALVYVGVEWLIKRFARK